MDETTAMQLALKHLDRQAYSEGKLRQKLELSGVSNPEAEEAITRLKSWGYLNDWEFGKNRVLALQARLKSREYVRCDLTENGLANALVDELLAAFYPRDAELEIARNFLKKRNRASKKPDPHARSNWAALARAGFSEETIHGCFPEIVI